MNVAGGKITSFKCQIASASNTLSGDAKRTYVSLLFFGFALHANKDLRVGFIQIETLDAIQCQILIQFDKQNLVLRSKPTQVLKNVATSAGKVLSKQHVNSKL